MDALLQRLVENPNDYNFHNMSHRIPFGIGRDSPQQPSG